MVTTAAARAWSRSGLAAIGVCLALTGLDALPKPSGPINDFADVLSAAQEAELTALSGELEDATTAELAVAIVTSLEGMTVEQYAEQLFREWGVGQRGKDNGVLVLVAPAEREMRIEVGYGLEGVLPDGLAGEIIRTSFIPRFRDNDYGGGVVEGTRRVAGIVRRNEVLSAEQRAAYERAASDAPSAWFIVPFLGMFVSIGFLLAGVGVAAQTMVAVIFGAIFGGGPLLVSLLIVPMTGFLVLCGVAAAGAALGMYFGRSSGGVLSMRGSTSKNGWVWAGSGRRRGRGSGGGSGGWSGGSSSSGSSSGFGGGRSGGGGASGKW